MVTNIAPWLLEQSTLILRGAWLRDQAASALPVLPKSGVLVVDLHGLTQVDSSLMIVLLSIREHSNKLSLIGVSREVKSLLTLYRLDFLFSQDGVVSDT